MGTDIHLYQEKKVDGRWESADEWEADEDGVLYVPWKKALYGDRNYHLFACLANVRNGFGFGGCDTGDPVLPISEPKGLPSDLSSPVRAQAEGWGSDGHSHSWLTADELEAYDWGANRVSRGILSLREYDAWKASGEETPSEYSGWVSGPNVLIVDEDDLTTTIRRELAFQGKNIFVRAMWKESLRASAEEFLSVVVPRLRQLESQFEGARIVFWFDN